MSRLLWAAVVAATIAFSSPSFAQRCPTVPAAVQSLTLARYEADNPRARAEHENAVRPLVQLTEQIARLSDRAAAGDNVAAKCAVVALETWANDGGYLGEFTTKQAIYQRGWDLVAITIVYLKVKHVASAEQQTKIESWLQQFADVVAKFYDDRNQLRNNQYYWMGAGQALVAVATDSVKHWQLAKQTFDHAMAAINADGMLPLELQRGSRALFYHAYAAIPLVLMAELADTIGEDWYKPKLHALIATTHKALGTSKPIFAGITGAKQDTTGLRPGWIQLYVARFPNRLKGPFKEIGDSHRSIGGSVDSLRLAFADVKKDQSRDDDAIEVPSDRPVAAPVPTATKKPCKCEDEPQVVEVPEEPIKKTEPKLLRRRPL